MTPSRWFGYGAAMLAAALSAWAYARLPPRVAVSWDEGSPVRFVGRLWASLSLPLLMLAARSAAGQLPGMGGRVKGASSRAPGDDWTPWAILNAALAILLLLHAVVMVNGVGFPVQVERVPVGIGGLGLAFVGTGLGGRQSSRRQGPGVPRTLTRAEPWRRVAGWIVTGGGVTITLTVFLPAPATPIAIGTLAAAAVMLAVSRYVRRTAEPR